MNVLVTGGAGYIGSPVGYVNKKKQGVYSPLYYNFFTREPGAVNGGVQMGGGGIRGVAVF